MFKDIDPSLKTLLFSNTIALVSFGILAAHAVVESALHLLGSDEDDVLGTMRRKRQQSITFCTSSVDYRARAR